MGSQLAAVALGQTQISDRARLVLARMALLAKDTDTEPVYYGGWVFLAGCLFPAYTPTAKQAVVRAVRELTGAGLIKPYGVPGPGHNVTYRLHL